MRRPHRIGVEYNRQWTDLAVFVGPQAWSTQYAVTEIVDQHPEAVLGFRYIPLLADHRHLLGRRPTRVYLIGSAPGWTGLEWDQTISALWAPDQRIFFCGEDRHDPWRWSTYEITDGPRWYLT